MSSPSTEVRNQQLAEEARERIMATPDKGGLVHQPEPRFRNAEPTAADRRVARESAERWVSESGRRIVDESTLRLELRVRIGGHLLSDSDVDDLVALARSEGANRKPASYLARRREAFEHVDTLRRARDRQSLPRKALDELRKNLADRLGLDEADVRDVMSRARGEML